MVRLPTAGQGRRRTGTVRALAILGVAAALAGCNTHREIGEAYPNDYRERHAISIREGEQRVELFIGSNRGPLTARQRAEVIAFAQAWRREATGGILIDVPAGTPNGNAAADAVPEVRSLLAAAGVPPNAVAAKPYRPANPIKLATLRLNYPRMVAEAGPCGQWPKDIGPSYDTADRENRPYWNLGCAQQRALAAMVDEPADLVQPRGDGPIFAARRSVVLEKYRKGEPTATTNPDANKGKISDIGQ